MHTLDPVRLISLPGLDPTRRYELTVSPGGTVAELVACVLPGLTDRKQVRVVIGGCEVAPEYWPRVRPKPGTAVVIRVIPAGGAFRSILALVVTVAAIAVGQFYLGPMIAGALGVTSVAGVGVVSALTVAGIATAGTLLVNALVPLKIPGAASGQAASPTYSINGFQNAFSPGGVIPNVLGKHRFAPPHAALPYTEIVANEQYTVALFNFGYGPVILSNIRLGDTSITTFANVEYEIREGYVTDTPVTLYDEQVIEESLDAEGENQPADESGNLPGQEIIRVTARDTVDASVDITFPEGLALYDANGNPTNLTVDVLIRQRKVGDPFFTTVTTLNITRALREVVRVSHRWTLPSRGQFEIGVTRVTENFTDADQRGRCFWSALRSFRPEYPIVFDPPLALVAVRIKATGELNGVVSNLNANVERVALDWDTGGQTWILRATRNPASLFRYVLQGPANAYPKLDAEIDLQGLQAWHEYCTAQGLYYDRVHDFEGSVWDALTDIAAAGRATPRDNGEKWGVVIDRPQTTIIGHISPRNSWGFSGERAYLQVPDGFRVTFRDESNGFQPMERVIEWPGFVGTPELVEEIQLPGITNPAQVFRETRRRQYEVIHRLDRYTVNQDIEGLVLVRGDLAQLSHDVLDRVQAAARVRAVDGTTVILDAPVTIDIGQPYAARFRRADGTSLLKTVAFTATGETAALHLNSGDMPAVGDLALFGKLGSESREVIVKDVEIGDNLTCRLSLVDHAPQIEAFANADTLPVWAQPFAVDPVSQGRPTTAAGSSGSQVFSTFNVPLPGSIASGDLLLIFVAIQENSARTITTPAGWTQLYNIVPSFDLRRFAAYWKSASGSEGASVAVTISDLAFWATVAYRVPAGKWTGTPEAATATGTNEFPNPPNLTPSWGSDDNLWLAIEGHTENSESLVLTPANYSNPVSALASGTRMVTVQRDLAAASENPGSFTLVGGSEHGAATVAVRRA